MNTQPSIPARKPSEARGYSPGSAVPGPLSKPGLVGEHTEPLWVAQHQREEAGLSPRGFMHSSEREFPSIPLPGTKQTLLEKSQEKLRHAGCPGTLGPDLPWVVWGARGGGAQPWPSALLGEGGGDAVV